MQVRFVVWLIAIVAIGGTPGLAQRQPLAESKVKDGKIERANPEKPDQKNAQKDNEDRMVRIRGRVQDNNGGPLSDVQIYLSPNSKWNKNGQRHFQHMATTVVDGHFEFDVPTDAYVRATASVNVVAIKSAYSLAWNEITLSGDEPELMLILARDDSAVEGQLVDFKGNALSGATVRISRIMVFANDDLEPYLDKIRLGGTRDDANFWNRPLNLEAELQLNEPAGSALPWRVLADQNGAFRLSGIGRDRLVELEIESEGNEYQTIRVVTQSLAEPLMLSAGGQPVPIYSAKFLHQTRPSRLVTGQVTVFGTDQTIEGAYVRTVSFAYKLSAVTDSKGRFEIRGCPDVESYGLMVHSPKGQPYMKGSVTMAATDDQSPMEAELHLYPAVQLSGRVIDERANVPIRGQVHYYVLAPNANDMPGFGESGINGRGSVSETRVQPDGTFEISVIHGQGAIAFLPEGPTEFERLPEIDPADFFEKAGVEYGTIRSKPKQKGTLILGGQDNFRKDRFGNDVIEETVMNVGNTPGVAFLNVPADAKRITQNILVKSKRK